jgi:hypothetical protein
MTNDHVLDLDELFGRDNPVTVKHGGKSFDLVRPSGLTPAQYSGWLALESRMEDFKKLGSEMTEQQSSEMEKTVMEIITLLNARLAKEELGFVKAMRIVQFYFETVFPDLVAKAKGNPKKVTGAASSQT